MKSDAVKILLVDDLEDNLVALSSLLAAQPVQVDVITARSGTEALEALLAHDVALALIDVHMPGMDGFELAELMRGTERTRHVPIIFVTASEETARVFKGYEAGAVDFLFKPVDPRLLRSKVDTFVQLYRQLAQLQQMLTLSDMFIAVLGHDLRSPLQSIETGCELLLGAAPGEQTKRRAASSIQQASRRMTRLINQLLDFALARVQGSIPVVPAACDLSELIQVAIAELEPAAAARIELRAVGNLAGTWDRDRMLQVLTNLTRNAVVHGEGGSRIAVDVDGSQRDRVTLAVTNRGHIAAERLASLFDPFTRAGKVTGVGLGLGLYIVDQILRSHGGEVRVSSSAPAGTRFEISVPRHCAASAG